MRLLIFVKHSYKTLKMSHIFYSYFIEDSCRAFIDLSFHIQSSSLSELLAKQSHLRLVDYCSLIRHIKL